MLQMPMIVVKALKGRKDIYTGADIFLALGVVVEGLQELVRSSRK
jgi:hypothetical protein